MAEVPNQSNVTMSHVLPKIFSFIFYYVFFKSLQIYAFLGKKKQTVGQLYFRKHRFRRSEFLAVAEVTAVAEAGDDVLMLVHARVNGCAP